MYMCTRSQESIKSESRIRNARHDKFRFELHTRHTRQGTHGNLRHGSFEETVNTKRAHSEHMSFDARQQSRTNSNRCHTQGKEHMEACVTVRLKKISSEQAEVTQSIRGRIAGRLHVPEGTVAW
jgi:hypothetical protein